MIILLGLRDANSGMNTDLFTSEASDALNRGYFEGCIVQPGKALGKLALPKHSRRS